MASDTGPGPNPFTGTISHASICCAPMLTELPADQPRLADYVSELSEEAYAAGWMHGPENAV